MFACRTESSSGRCIHTPWARALCRPFSLFFLYTQFVYYSLIMYTTRTGQRDCCKVPQGSPVLYTLTVYINRRNRSRERIKSPPTGSCSLGVEASTINKRKKETSLPTPNMSAGRKQDALIIGTRFFFLVLFYNPIRKMKFSFFPPARVILPSFFVGKV